MEVCQTPSKEHAVRFINIVGILPTGAECMAKEARRVREATGVDEVALSLSLHPEGFPAIRKPEFYTKLFRRYRKALEGSGVKAGILLQSLIGHGWPGAPVSPEPWQRTVEIGGSTTLRMCPADPGFREYVRQTVMMLAREKPYAFLVDDDIRLINGARLECFCPRHLARFNELAGKNFSADELREAVRNARPGDPLLACFETVRRQSLLEFADLIRGAIDAVDPSIPCGFCTASWESPIAGEFAKRLAGKHRPYLRINNALYLERSAKDFPGKMSYTLMLRKFHEEIPELLDEADTFPQYRYSKSALSMHAHITGAILNGLNGAKLWLTNTRWHDPETAREYEQILARHRNFYPELARTMRKVRLQGPIVPLMPGKGNWHPLKLNSFFYETDWNGSLLGQFGIPARWEKLPVKGVRMLAGEDSIAFFSDDELRELLSGPLLLDGTAARAVAARGFAKELGVTPETREYRFSYEENCLTGEPVTFMNDFISPYLAVNSEKTEMISKLMATPFRGSPEASFVAPGVTLFRNALGGTVAVFARHLKMSPNNHQSPGHRRLLLQVLDRLNGKPLPYVVMELQNIYVLHGKMEDGTDFLSIFNLNFDPMNSIRLRVQKPVAEILELTPEGVWKPLEWTQNGEKLEIAKRLIDYEAAILKIRTAEPEAVPDWRGIFPEKIKTVALVAPACPAHSSEALDRAIAGLKKVGIRVKLMPHAREGEPATRYETIEVAKRVADLEQAWLDPEVDLVWCIRGGTGTPDVVAKLDWEKLRRRPDLPLLGFSDITALQLAMLKERAGHPFTAPSVLGLLTVDAPSLENFRRMMHGKSAEPLPLVPVRGGEASGLALAGHLRLLETMSRTRFRSDTAGRVIFVESPDYLPDQVRASLGRLREAGFFDACAAVVFGTLSRCGDEAEAVIRDFAGTVKVPVYMGFPYGHTPRNQVIDLRGRVTIDSRGVLRR